AGLLAAVRDLVLLRQRPQGLHALAVLRRALAVLLALALELALPLAESLFFLSRAALLLREGARRRGGPRRRPLPFPLAGPFPLAPGLRLATGRLLGLLDLFLVHQPRLQELVSKTVETHRDLSASFLVPGCGAAKHTYLRRGRKGAGGRPERSRSVLRSGVAFSPSRAVCYPSIAFRSRRCGDASTFVPDCRHRLHGMRLPMGGVPGRGFGLERSRGAVQPGGLAGSPGAGRCASRTVGVSAPLASRRGERRGDLRRRATSADRHRRGTPHLDLAARTALRRRRRRAGRDPRRPRERHAPLRGGHALLP